jgi:Domain of unknown function (DUF4412)
MKVRIGFLGLAATWMAAVQAGTVVHLERRDLPDGAAHPNSVIYAQDGQFRMDALDEKGHVRDFVLVRDDSIWQVDVEKRTFYKFDKAALAGQQGQMQERMQAMLQNLPPERRAMMEERMKGMMQKMQQTNLTMTDTGHGDRAGSWPCQVWQLLRDGKAVSESCIASRGSLTGGDELVDATHKASALATDVLSSLPAARSAAQRFALYGKVDGFPVRTREISSGKAESEEVVTSIERQSLPADKFAIPKGFTQTTLGGAEE